MKRFAKIKERLGRRLDRADDALRRACGRMAPEKRLLAVAAALLLFAAGALYVTIRAVYEIGRNDALRELPQIEHIRPLDLHPEGDSTHTMTIKPYGHERQ